MPRQSNVGLRDSGNVSEETLQVDTRKVLLMRLNVRDPIPEHSNFLPRRARLDLIHPADWTFLLQVFSLAGEVSTFQVT
jgi:hypothetical protein